MYLSLNDVPRVCDVSTVNHVLIMYEQEIMYETVCKYERVDMKKKACGHKSESCLKHVLTVMKLGRWVCTSVCVCNKHIYIYI